MGYRTDRALTVISAFLRPKQDSEYFKNEEDLYLIKYVITIPASIGIKSYDYSQLLRLVKSGVQ